MTNSELPDKLRTALNAEVVRRKLLQYFLSKGYGVDSKIYPPMIQDMTTVIPELASKVEILPYAKNVDLISDSAEIGWNLFVLGNHRQYLGESHHTDVIGLSSQINSGLIAPQDNSASRMVTPRRIVNFITKTLCSHKSGYINLDNRTTRRLNNINFNPATASQTFHRNVSTI